MKLNKNLIFLIIFMSFSETLAQFFVRKYHENSSKKLYIALAWGLYFLVIYILEKTYDYSGMAFANAIWSGLTILTVCLVDIYYFNETITKREWIGFVFIILGILISGT